MDYFPLTFLMVKGRSSNLEEVSWQKEAHTFISGSCIVLFLPWPAWLRSTNCWGITDTAAEPSFEYLHSQSLLRTWI